MARANIVGLVLVRNEELYVEQAVRNASVFCDRMMLCDHSSTDGTLRILQSLARELPATTCHVLKHPRESHHLIRPFCGTDHWIFAVDGDEIYDPFGLARLRYRIDMGEFDASWMLFGNVLNVTRLEHNNTSATGHLSPPCRSMTKLYNFAAVESWDGECVERLHGGNPVFRRGFAATDRRYLHEETPWKASDFRCLHLCFLTRSSSAETSARRNIMETYGSGRLRRLLSAACDLLGKSSTSQWKNERYRRGPEVKVDAKQFFPPMLSL